MSLLGIKHGHTPRDPLGILGAALLYERRRHHARNFWSPSVLNSGADGTYIAANAKYTLPNLPHDIGWCTSADVGHWFLGTSDAFYGNITYKSYTNWDVGLAFTWSSSRSICTTSAPTSTRATATPSPAIRPPRGTPTSPPSTPVDRPVRSAI